nr:hypothetical protein [Tanacetum cinerariifolium]
MNEDYYHEQNFCCDSNSFGFDDCQPPQYTVNHPIFNTHHDYLDSQKEFSITLNNLKEQMTSLTSFCEMTCQIVQKKLEEKHIEEEQAAKAQNRKLPVCYDDDDDEEESNPLKDNIISELPPCSAVTPSEPVDSLSMGDEHLDTIPATESDEFIKSCVENLVPNPSESEGETGCDVPSCFTTFSNFLFDGEYEFDSVDDQSLYNEDFSKKIFSSPLFEEEISSIKKNQHHFNADIPENLKTLAKGFYPPSLNFPSFNWESLNEIRAEKIARVANPLALVVQQQPVYHPQTHSTHYNQNSSTRTQQAATRNKGKAIVNSPQPIYDQEPSMVNDDDETSKDKEIDKLMALISLSFKKIYKPTNNNLRTSSNTSHANQDNSPRINKNDGATKIARVANPHTLVAQQQPAYHPQNHPTHYTKNSSTRSLQAATRNRGKSIVNSPQPIYDQQSSMVDKDDETSKDKEIDKLMALISLSFKKIYKPTNNNLRTSSNTNRAYQDNSPRINRSTGFENQRKGNVAGARETVGSSVEEDGIQLNAEQADWRDDTDDDELKDQELEAHYMYMAQLQEISPDVVASRPIFDNEPLQKVSNDDHYNVFSMESVHPEQSKSDHDTYPIEQD